MSGKNLINSRSEYTRQYRNPAGVNIGSDVDGSCTRLSYCENMYRDYSSEGSAIESIPGYRRILNTNGAVNGIFVQIGADGKEYLIVHSEDNLYRYRLDDIDSLSLGLPICSVNNHRSTGFSVGADYYILDGADLTRIDSNGLCTKLTDGTLFPYIPTTYYSGHTYEQRNLLSDSFIEIHEITSAKLHTFGSDGLKYVITDTENRKCLVSGVDERVEGEIIIPHSITLSGETYAVDGVEAYAFRDNNKITSVVMNEGITEIGRMAFYNMKNLIRVVTPSSIKYIDNAAFSDCSFLSYFYLGREIDEFGINVFSSCHNLSEINYGADEDRLSSVVGKSVLSGLDICYCVDWQMTTVALTVNDECESVGMVLVDGESKDFEMYKRDGKNYVKLEFVHSNKIDGKKVEIHGTLKVKQHSFGEEKSIGGIDAICKCTIAETFDGRIFLSGNPNLPNTVFYTAMDINGKMNPLYFGEYDYFNDGVGGFPVISMLAVRDSLAVFKARDDGSGSIFYHRPESTGDNLVPRIYPTVYVHSGLCAVGKSFNFLDDPVFLSKEGLCAITRENIEYERSIACRSHNVNKDLLKEDLSSATLLEWLGYLCVCVNGSIYMADSRRVFTHPTGNTEYEWFKLCDIGCRKYPENVYRYASVAPIGMGVHPDEDGICQGEIGSLYTAGKVLYYCRIGNVRYAAYLTEQKTGGIFYSAKTFFSYEDLLIFGTDNGEICVFNNDKRGVAPDYVKSMDDFSSVEYAMTMADKIHPYFYSFDNFAPRYAVKTVNDNCDIPHLSKNTVKHSLVIKCKAFNRARFICEIGTDRNGYSEITSFSGNLMDFCETDFGNFAFESSETFTVPLSEKEKNWIEKQIAIYSDEYCSPIGIYSITYRYTIKGKIKKR